MKTIHTFNALHLGDNLIHLHFLRKLAQKYPEIHFTHGAPEEHLRQLSPLADHLPNLSLAPIGAVGQGAINAWRGAGGWFYQQPDQWDFLQIHLRWFRHLASLMGLESPIECAADMLFDYPALQRSDARGRRSSEVLVINSAPKSGQWSGYSEHGFDLLVESLVDYGYHVTTTAPTRSAVPCTQWQNLDVTAIGKLSQCCSLIIGCVTGPMWGTLSVFNPSDTLRIHLLDTERVDLAPNTVHANHLSLVPEILRDRGLL